MATPHVRDEADGVSAAAEARSAAYEALQPVWDGFADRLVSVGVVAPAGHTRPREKSAGTPPSLGHHVRGIGASVGGGDPAVGARRTAEDGAARPAWVLDVASGAGEPACTVAARLGGAAAVRVVSSDVADKFAALAKERAQSKGVGAAVTTATLDAADLGRAGLPTEVTGFDAVTCCFGLMYTDHAAAIIEAARVLRPGGVFVATVWHGVAVADVTERVLVRLLAEPSRPDQPGLAKFRRAFVLMKAINAAALPTAVPTRLRDPAIVDAALGDAGLEPLLAHGHNRADAVALDLGPVASPTAWRAGLVLVLSTLERLVSAGELAEAAVSGAFASVCADLGHVDDAGRCVLRGSTYRWVVSTKPAASPRVPHRNQE